MFAQMAQQLLQHHSLGAEPNSIDLVSYLEWQLNYTFDALQNIRYGQSFCNYFGITDYVLFYMLDWDKADQHIRKLYLAKC